MPRFSPSWGRRAYSPGWLSLPLQDSPLSVKCASTCRLCLASSVPLISALLSLYNHLRFFPSDICFLLILNCWTLPRLCSLFCCQFTFLSTPQFPGSLVILWLSGSPSCLPHLSFSLHLSIPSPCQLSFSCQASTPCLALSMRIEILICHQYFYSWIFIQLHAYIFTSLRT